MTDTALTDLAHEFADQLTKHNVEALRRDHRADYLNHNPYVAPVRGPEPAIEFFTQWLDAFPDAEVICEDVVTAGTPAAGTVVGRYTYVGTFEQPILGIPATGKRVIMRSIDIWRVRDGQFVEHWDELNTADWFAQLEGADPQPRTGVTL